MKLNRFLGLLFLLFVFVLTSCEFGSINSSKQEDENITTYSISDDYFEYIGFKPMILVKANLVDHTSIETPVIKVLGKCKYSLTEVSISAKLYNSNNELIYSFSESLTSNIEANEEFDLSSEVTAYVQANTSTVLATFSGKSIEKPDESSLSFTISNDFFEYTGFKPIVLVETNFVNNTSIETPYIEVSGKCKYSLTEVTVNAKLYNRNNELLFSFSESLTLNIEANEEFSLSSQVTAYVQANTNTVVAMFSGKSTKKPAALL